MDQTLTVDSAPKRRKRRRHVEPVYLSEEELDGLLRAIDGVAQNERQAVRDRAIIRLAYHAGLRASEVGLIDIRDYNPRTERVYIRRLKGSNSGEHHMCKEEARALRAWLRIRGNHGGALFPSRLGSRISRDQMDYMIKRYGAAAGLGPRLLHFHVLKHTCCTHLRARGVRVEDVQDWVGHARIDNTIIYSHVTNEGREAVAARLRDTWR